MNFPEITEVKYSPCQKQGSLIGFVDFVYDQNIRIQGAGVHCLLDDPLNYRLVYPKNLTDGRNSMFPIKREISKYIDSKITEAVNQQINQGVKYDSKNIKVRSKNQSLRIKN